MAYKRLGGANPTLNTDTDIYTCPSSKTFIVVALWFCNTSSTPCTVRAAVRPDGATLATQHYFIYEVTLDGNWFGVLKSCATGDQSDVLTVRCSTSNVAVNAYGDES